jgi:transcriptional regulator with XRE-family HTH domain
VSLSYSPAVRRKRLGAEITAIRKKQNESLRSLASRVGIAASQLSRLENGKTGKPDLVLVMDILDALGVVDPKREELITLCRAANASGWYKAITSKNLERTRDIAEVEVGVKQIRQYSVMSVPGLLQTADYARSVFALWDGYETGEIDEAVKFRATRQMVLDDEGFKYEALLDEALLTRLPCEPAMMAAQLDRLVELSERLSIKVVPVETGYRKFLPSNEFSLLSYADPDEPLVAFVETGTADFVVDDGDQVASYERGYQALKARSKSEADSRKVIAERAKYLRA